MEKDKITKQRYIEALEIVHAYTLQEIQEIKFNDHKMVQEANRMNSIIEKVYELMTTYGLALKTRRAEIVWKRQAIAWWLRKNTSKSLDEIGRILGLDHATVIYSCRKVDALQKDNLFMMEVSPVLGELEVYNKPKK